MGSLAPEADNSEKEIDVLVTGFGAFGENTTNSSYLIARSLPSRLERPKLPPINIHVHNTPVIVSYSHVRAIIPGLIFSQDASKDVLPDTETIYIPPDHMRDTRESGKETPNYDIILNIGMAPGRKFFTLETCAHRDGYNKRDVEGKTMEGDTFWKEEYKSPEIPHTSFDTEDVWRRWKLDLMDEDVRPSNDAGHYLCDFTYYTSILEYWRRDSQGWRPCMFLHVPGGWGAEDVRQGRGVALGLIAACVGSEMTRQKEKRKGRSSGIGSEDVVAHDFGDEWLS